MDSSLDHKGHYYAVPFDSSLGVQIKTYITRCNNSENAVRDFIYSLQQKYAFPLPVTDHTSYMLSDDCEAGGLLAILVSRSDFESASLDERCRALWSAIPSPDDDTMLCLLPRIEAHTHYIKYGKAVRMFEHKAVDWLFALPTQRDKSNGMKLHVVTYDEVRNRISREDKEALVRKPGTTPSAALRLAVGKQYVPVSDPSDAISFSQNAMNDYLSDAIALYREWMNLPNVPANTLARILGLRPVSSDAAKDTENCFCEWQTDADHQRFIIHTGLKSDLLTEVINH